MQNDGLPAKLRRIRALVRKEFYQIVRDPSTIMIGIAMPIMMILLFGYALSLDVKSVPVAVVIEDTSPAAAELVAGFRLSSYFKTEVTTSMAAAEELMLERKVDGIVRIPQDFSRNLSFGKAEVQVHRLCRRCQSRAHH